MTGRYKMSIKAREGFIRLSGGTQDQLGTQDLLGSVSLVEGFHDQSPGILRVALNDGCSSGSSRLKRLACYAQFKTRLKRACKKKRPRMELHATQPSILLITHAKDCGRHVGILRPPLASWNCRWELASYGQYFWCSKRTWILCNESSSGHNMAYK